MTSIWSTLKLSDFDLFGQEATFYINEQQKKHTRFGGIISIILGLITASFTIYCLVEVFSRSKFNFTTQEDKQQDFSFGLSKDKFFFATGLRNVSTSDFSAYFSLALQVTKQTRPPNDPSNPISSSTTYPMALCNQSQLNSTAHNLTQNFTAFGLSNYYCPTISEFPFEGSYLNWNYTYIDLILKPCDGLPSCKPKQEIAAFLADRDSLILDFFYTTSSVYLDRHSNPVGLYFESVSWTLSPLAATKNSEVFITPEIIKSKNSYLGGEDSETIKTHSIQKQQIRDSDSNFVRSGEPYAKIFMKTTLQLNSFIHAYSRSYTTFLDIASRIGGIYAFLIATLGFIAIRFNRYEIKVEIARQIYEYKAHDPKGQKDPSSHQNESFEERKDGGDENQNRERSVSLQSVTSEKKYENFMKKFDVLLNKPTMKTSFRQFLQTLTNFVCGNSAIEIPGSKKFALQQIEQKISSDLDVIQILRRIQELEKLKDLLLIKDQKIVLQYTPKPKFFQTKDDMDNSRESSAMIHRSQALLPVQLEFQSEKDFLLLYKAYQGLLNDNDPDRAAQNEILKHKLGEELLAIFEEFDKEIERDPSFLNYLFSKDRTALNIRKTNMMKPTMVRNTLTPRSNNRSLEQTLEEPLLESIAVTQNPLDRNSLSEVYLPPKKVIPSEEKISEPQNEAPSTMLAKKDLKNSVEMLDDIDITTVNSVIVKFNKK